MQAPGMQGCRQSGGAGPGPGSSTLSSSDSWKSSMVAALRTRQASIRQQQGYDGLARVHPGGPGGKQPPSPTASACSVTQTTACSAARTSHQLSTASTPGHAASSLSWEDFHRGRVIGMGSFGRVSIATHKASGTVYVIKSLSKAGCIRDGQVRHVLDEKALLNRLSPAKHPFLVNLRGAFQDVQCLHLVLDFVPGGEFFAFLRDFPTRMGRKMNENEARFYTAQVVLALEFLHSQGIAFRDLKPENMLMGEEGYIRVTDFGFAKEVPRDGTYTMCGTPDYLAPEVILSKGHGLAVDWWSLGCVVYEMLHGFPPFYSNGDATATYKAALERRLVFPPDWSNLVMDLINGLLQPDPKHRFGVSGGTQALKQHGWFQGLNWEFLLGKRYAPPYKPQVKGPGDTSNFDDYASLPPMSHPFPLTPDQQRMFQNF